MSVATMTNSISEICNHKCVRKPSLGFFRPKKHIPHEKEIHQLAISEVKMLLLPGNT